MLRRAGYIQGCRCAAVGEDGRPCRIVEVRLDGRRFGVRVDELRLTLAGRYPARVRLLGQDWGQALGAVVGLAERSRTGAALIITLGTGERYTVPAAALRAVLARVSAFAPISAVLPGSRQQVLVTG